MQQPQVALQMCFVSAHYDKLIVLQSFSCPTDPACAFEHNTRLHC
jgi:hypothetical protein